jgi:hypothetical protein
MSRARRNSLCARVQRQQQEQRWRDDERRDRRARAQQASSSSSSSPNDILNHVPSHMPSLLAFRCVNPTATDRPFDLIRVPIVCPEKVCKKGAF